MVGVAPRAGAHQAGVSPPLSHTLAVDVSKRHLVESSGSFGKVLTAQAWRPKFRSWSVLWGCLCGIGVLFTVNVQNTFCLLLLSSGPLSPQKKDRVLCDSPDYPELTVWPKLALNSQLCSWFSRLWHQPSHLALTVFLRQDLIHPRLILNSLYSWGLPWIPDLNCSPIPGIQYCFGSLR